MPALGVGSPSVLGGEVQGWVRSPCSAGAVCTSPYSTGALGAAGRQESCGCKAPLRSRAFAGFSGPSMALESRRACISPLGIAQLEYDRFYASKLTHYLSLILYQAKQRSSCSAWSLDMVVLSLLFREDWGTWGGTGSGNMMEVCWRLTSQDGVRPITPSLLRLQGQESLGSHILLPL